MNHELVIAAMLGLIGGVIPGPVITAVFTEILQSGFFKSLRIIFLAFIVESLVAIVSLVVFYYLGLPEFFFRAISLAGAGILAWISFSLWKVRSLETGVRITFGSWKIILMILTNGVLWTYWLTICIPKAILLNEQIRMGAYLFMGCVQLGWLLSTVAVAFVFMRFRPLLTRPRVVAVVFKVCSLAFLYFAIDMIYKSIAYFISLPPRPLS